MARSRFSERGFSLIEVLVSMGLLTVAALSVAQLFAVATDANLNAKGQTSTAVLAVQKMEQLRGLTWGHDQTTFGLPVSDTTSDLTTDPPSQGGTGLNPSPAGTLHTNTPGFVDYLDETGRWIGNGAEPQPKTYYIRRWSIEPLPTNPNNTLVLQVLVTTMRREVLRGSAQRRRLTDDTRLVGLKTRKSS